MRQSVGNIRIVTILVAAVIGTTLISACRTAPGARATGAAASSWRMLGHDRAHTGRSPFDTSANPGSLNWRFATAGVVSSPVIDADGAIYVGSGDSNLYAVGANGVRKWAFKADTAVGTPALAEAGTIYVRAGENLYAVDQRGAKKWAFSLGEGSASPAIAKDGTIYVADDQNLYSLHADGTLRWKSAISYAARSSPAIGADGTIYLGSGDGNLYAFNSDGTRKWAFATGSFVDSSPAIGEDGTIYVGSGYPNARLYAVTPQGAQRWAFASGTGASFSAPAIGADNTIYAGCYDGSLYAISSDGTKKWSLPIGVVGNAAPAIGADGTIYVGSDDFKLHAIKADGTEKWALATGSDAHSSAAIGADGTVYIGSGDNSLYAVGVAPQPPAKPVVSKGPVWPTFHHDSARTGRSDFSTSANAGVLKWAFTVDRSELKSVSDSVAIARDGVIYSGSGDHYLYAVNPDGTQKWKFNADDNVGSPSLAEDGTIYFGTPQDFSPKSGGHLYALNPDGSKKWILEVPREPNSFDVEIKYAPAIAGDGTIYVAAAQYLSAVTPAGVLKWKFKGANQPSMAPAVGADQTIYIVFTDFSVQRKGSYASGHLYALTPAGTMKWQFTTPYPPTGSSVAIANDGTIYTGSTEVLLYAIDSDGHSKWQLPAKNGAALITTPAIGPDGTIYFGSKDCKLYAVKPDGSIKWQYEIGKIGYLPTSSPAISSDGTIYIGSNYGLDSPLYALNPDGTLKWKFSNGLIQEISSSPAIGADGTVYFGASDGNLYAVGAAVGPQPSR